jgi:hypothetical protein
LPVACGATEDFIHHHPPKTMMKTFSIRLKSDRTIEGVQYTAGFQVGAVTSEVGPLTLLGLVNFNHAVLEEVTDSLDDEGDTSADGDDGEPEAGGSVTPQDGVDDSQSDPPDEETVAAPPAGETQPVAGDAPPLVQPGVDDAVAAFMAAGLDKATAEALAIANKIASLEELNTLLSDPDFDLIDLEDIGAVRAEKIKAIFSPSAT